jgi:hypothetical protein
MQHDWLQGPAIDGRARDFRDDSAGKKFIVLHGRQRRAGLKRSRCRDCVGSPQLAGSLAQQRPDVAADSAFDAFAIRRR